jgi:hypothetical protein
MNGKGLQEFRVLPEVLSPGILMEALAKANVAAMTIN